MRLCVLGPELCTIQRGLDKRINKLHNFRGKGMHAQKKPFSLLITMKNWRKYQTEKLNKQIRKLFYFLQSLERNACKTGQLKSRWKTFSCIKFVSWQADNSRINITTVVRSIYRLNLLTKREAGHWPSSLIVCLWTSTVSWSITRKKINMIKRIISSQSRPNKLGQ